MRHTDITMSTIFHKLYQLLYIFIFLGFFVYFHVGTNFQITGIEHRARRIFFGFHLLRRSAFQCQKTVGARAVCHSPLVTLLPICQYQSLAQLLLEKVKGNICASTSLICSLLPFVLSNVRKMAIRIVSSTLSRLQTQNQLQFGICNSCFECRD